MASCNATLEDPSLYNTEVQTEFSTDVLNSKTAVIPLQNMLYAYKHIVIILYFFYWNLLRITCSINL